MLVSTDEDVQICKESSLIRSKGTHLEFLFPHNQMRMGDIPFEVWVLIVSQLNRIIQVLRVRRVNKEWFEIGNDVLTHCFKVNIPKKMAKLHISFPDLIVRPYTLNSINLWYDDERFQGTRVQNGRCLMKTLDSFTCVISRFLSQIGRRI